LINRASDLIEEEKLDETQSSNFLFITINLKRLFADFRILERVILSK
jgi:hypothetical protein